MEPFFADFDLAQLSLYLFWLFFAGLVIYIQRENMREGYPLETEDGKESANQGPYDPPSNKKVFRLPHGRGEVSLPDFKRETREVALERTNLATGSPLLPTGDPMEAGVGPASWSERRDLPELDGHGNPKLRPMKSIEGFDVSAGRDPREMPVISADNENVGTVVDLWIDVPEQLVRYLEVKLNDNTNCLIPVPLAKINSKFVLVNSLYGKHFTNIPKTKSSNEVTMLEEEKISGYVGGGNLYASYDRLSSPF